MPFARPAGQPVPPGSTQYYFCQSHTREARSGEKQQVLFTAISKAAGEESVFTEKAKGWGAFVQSRCNNRQGCTSDLNSYPTQAEAEKAFQHFLSAYADTARYQVSQVDFR